MPSAAVATAPRKRPRQERSRATVEAIITATAHILVEHGYDGMTTGRVARRAGVSIGSLYQYFPNREALVATLVERHAGEVTAILGAALAHPEAVSLEDGLRAYVEAGVGAHRLNPSLHKILSEQVPRIGKIALAMDTHRQIAKALEAFLLFHKDRLRPGLDPAFAAFILETATEAIVHRGVLECPDMLAGDAIEPETLGLMIRYLC